MVMHLDPKIDEFASMYGIHDRAFVKVNKGDVLHFTQAGFAVQVCANGRLFEVTALMRERLAA